jgi:hypothetical protein
VLKNFNTKQINRLSEFLANMSVAWFIGTFITKINLIELTQFVILGSISLMISLVLLKEVVDYEV